MKKLYNLITEKFEESKYTSYETFGKMFNPFAGYFDENMANNWFRQFESTAKSLSSDVVDSIDNYRDLIYVRFNNALRKGKLTDKEFKTVDEDLQKALKEFTLKQDIVVYRGIADTSIAKKFLSAKEGQTFSDKAYTSTSLNESIADKFIDKKKGVKLKIYVPKGTNILPMQILGSDSTKTMYDDEYEILLTSNTKLKVLDVNSEIVTLIVV